MEHYYREDAEERKERWRLNEINIDKKVEIAVDKKVETAVDKKVEIAVDKKSAETKEAIRPDLLREAVNAALDSFRNEFAASVSTLIPAVIDWMKQNLDKGAADFPVPSFVGSNSVNIAPALAPAPAHSSPSSVSGMLSGALTLAELDALTVITRRTLINISIIFHFRCLSDV